MALKKFRLGIGSSSFWNILHSIIKNTTTSFRFNYWTLNDSDAIQV